MNLPATRNDRAVELTWLGQCPSHWPLRRLKYLVNARVQKCFPDGPLLTASQIHGVIAKADYGSRTVEAQKDLHLLKLVEPGDYVISLRSFQGGIEFAHARGIISPAYTVLALAHALTHGHPVVTQEQPAPNAAKVKIPDVCRALGVEFRDAFQVLDELGARFVLEATA